MFLLSKVLSISPLKRLLPDSMTSNEDCSGGPMEEDKENATLASKRNELMKILIARNTERARRRESYDLTSAKIAEIQFNESGAKRPPTIKSRARNSVKKSLIPNETKESKKVTIFAEIPSEIKKRIWPASCSVLPQITQCPIEKKPRISLHIKEEPEDDPEELGPEIYQIERIMAARKSRVDGRMIYLIKWYNWRPETCTWEGSDAIQAPEPGVRSKVASFEKRLKFYKSVKRYLPDSEWGPPKFVGSNMVEVATKHKKVFDLQKFEDKWQALLDERDRGEVFLENWSGDGKTPTHFQFIVESIKSPQVEEILSRVLPPDSPTKCDCPTGCGKKRTMGGGTKCCFRQYANVASYGKRGLLDVDSLTKDDRTIAECSSLCSCDLKTCSQRVVQRGNKISLCVFREGKKGWGLRAVEPISKGQFVVEYVGEILTLAEAQSDSRANTYQWTMMQAVPGQDPFVMDAARTGNEARFINHACNPNLVSMNIVTDQNSLYTNRIALFALRDIKIGEELTFNYFPTKEMKFTGKRCLCCPGCDRKL